MLRVYFVNNVTYNSMLNKPIQTDKNDGVLTREIFH